MGAINLKKKQSAGKTLLCCEYLLDKYPNPDAKILQIEKFTVSAQVTQEHRPRIFFQPTVQCICGNFIFFLWRWSCAGIFFLRIFACRISFFFNHQLPPIPPKVKWLIPWRAWQLISKETSMVKIDSLVTVLKRWLWGPLTVIGLLSAKHSPLVLAWCAGGFAGKNATILSWEHWRARG